MKNLLYFVVLILLFLGCSKEDKADQSKTQISAKVESTQNLDSRTIRDLLFANGFESKVDSKIQRIGGRCAPEVPAGADCFTFESQGIIAVPADGNTPGCDNTSVTFEIIVCVDANGNLVSVHISNFDAVPDPLGCDELWNYWNNRPGDMVGLSIEAFIYRASLLVESYVVGALMGDNFPCPSNYVSSTFTNDICYQQCLTQIEGPPFIKILNSHCGSVCCERSTEWCKDIHGTPMPINTVFDQVGDFGSCEDNPIGLCKGFPISSCEHTCGPIVEL